MEQRTLVELANELKHIAADLKQLGTASEDALGFLNKEGGEYAATASKFKRVRHDLKVYILPRIEYVYSKFSLFQQNNLE